MIFMQNKGLCIAYLTACYAWLQKNTPYDTVFETPQDEMDDNIFMYHNLISLCRVCCSTKPRYDILYVRDILRYKRTIYFTFHKYYRTSIFYLMWDVVYMCTRICVLSVLFLKHNNNTSFYILKNQNFITASRRQKSLYASKSIKPKAYFFS